MPIDSMKVKDMLRNQHMYRRQIIKDIPNYENMLNDSNWEAGILTYINEAAWGDLRELLKDVNIT